MSRMYSRKKGRSGSSKPLQRIAPWVKYKPQEIEELVVKLAKKEKSSAEIGTVLRDQYGIPSTRLAAKNRVSRIMKKHKVYNKTYPEDMLSLLIRAVDLSAHLEKNKKDYTSKRGMELTESKIRRLGKYYKKRGVLPQDWKYDLEKTKLLVK